MCGRYQLGIAGKNKFFGLRFKVDEKLTLKLKDNYNIAPSAVMPVVIKQSPNSISMMRWGLIPSWSKDGKSLVINARSESVAEKPLFRNIIKNRRCIIPATGFYEWKKTTDDKIPYFIGPKDEGFFSFAGLYDVWINPKGEEVKTYVIMTCAPNSVMSTIHNRMPVILRKEDEDIWLDKNTESSAYIKLLKPVNDGSIIAHPVSKRVNSPSYNDPHLADEVTS